MVIEVSKELDVRRIGIDRYSLKTGLNLRSIMDVSLQVLKEPRGFIRVLQILMAVLAFATTVGFSTECQFNVPCPGEKDDEIEVVYEIDYPFSSISLSVPEINCKEDSELEYVLPFDFSNPAEFFVTTGVLAFLYSIGILVVYIFFHQSYAQNNRLPVADLAISALLTVFWLAGSSAWAQGVVDLKFYMEPERLSKLFAVCIRPGTDDCDDIEDGSYGTLNASVILGFANFLLWLASLWFVYKETIFHVEPTAPETTQNNQQTKGAGRV